MQRGLAASLFLVFAFATGAGAQQSAAPAGQAAGPDTGTEASQPSSPGSIHGTVVSSDGAVYEGVKVALTEAAGNGAKSALEKTEITDSDGEFTFTGVPPGPFKLTLTSTGFVTKTIAGRLGAGQSFETQEIVLPVAEATTEVKVSASTVEIAEEQLHFEEQQRVLGVIPNFYVSYDHDAAPLTTRQKYSLAWRSNIDPFTWLVTAGFAGVEQAENTFSGYGQGAQGYAKRYGANYADSFIGTMIGGAVLPSLLKQDPRYFYKGTGTVRSRALYAIANSVVCKGDNGRWQFNYSGILGSFAAGGISNLYYPASDRNGPALTFEEGVIGIGSSAVGNLLQEFVVKKLTPKTPKYPAP